MAEIGAPASTSPPGSHVRAARPAAATDQAAARRRRGGPGRAEVKAKIRDLASEAGAKPPDAFAQRIKEELVVWRDTAKAAGIEPE